MSPSHSRTRRLALLSSVLVLFMSAPVAFSQTSGVAFNDACAQTGTCCPQMGEVCMLGDDVIPNHYYMESGSCNSEPGVGTCCYEAYSWCNDGYGTLHRYYFSASGNCL